MQNPEYQKTASVLNYSTQAVGFYLKQFEDEYGVELFDHQKNKLSEKPIVEIILPRLVSLKEKEDEIKDLLENWDEDRPLNIALSKSLSYQQISHVQFCDEKNGGQKYAITSLYDVKCEKSFREGSVDMAICALTDDSFIKSAKIICSCNAGLIVHSEHPLYGKMRSI